MLTSTGHRDAVRKSWSGAFLPWWRLVMEAAQDYKLNLKFEMAAFAALYKLVEAKVVRVLATAGAIAQNGRRLYIGEDDVTLALNLVSHGSRMGTK